MTQEELIQDPRFREILEDFIAEIVWLLETEVKPETEIVVKGDRLSPQILSELISHEGIVLEAYKDSVGVWTWGIGVTNASGHRVNRYKDNPQPLSKVFDIFDWLVRTKYLPSVRAAFTRPLTDEQLAAALSFHYNTGAIKRASWVKSFNKGDTAKARREIMNWVTPKEITERREKERDLFFDGKWSSNGTATLYTKVNKPSYAPNWRSGKKVNIREELNKWAS